MRWATAVLATLIIASGCATTTTQLAPISPEDVLAEERAQRELVLIELLNAEQRLNNLAYPLLRAATPLCETKAGPRIGVALRSSEDYRGPWIDAARSGLNLTDTVSVVVVADGSAAQVAGLKVGDRLLAIGSVPIEPGRNATSAALRLLRDHGTAPLSIAVTREGTRKTIEFVPEVVCDLGTIVTAEGDINAYADGKNIIFPWAMMRFADDDELRAVIAHEIAHNAMGHIEARRQNMLLSGLLGALADVALATQGVNTGGQNTADFMALGARAFSQNFEREADYVGMYIMARAGVPLEGGPNLWRQFAQINPAAIAYASTHPTTAERFVRLRAAIEEIEAKMIAGTELLPEMKGQ
jgi:beta-barrel assembly-enhancing protease